ncbi:phage minor structural protein [Enterococcus sp. AZ091]|uniref:phage head closure protein n=1 Tax=Enterococcus TaxID=1350 RepID=UPI002090847E|nr:phage head closure protein [Enterococcus gallinarum]MBE6171053.1 phage head-tail joining protein [Enterococcus casseliflavus]MCO5478216.1 phage head closure protein [Enterococcus gallinarum]
MPKRQTNKLRWKAELMDVIETVDDRDRPVAEFQLKRPLWYEDIGVTAQEKYLSKQAKTDVVRRIKVRWDKSITEKLSAVRIDSVTYNITRIYTDVDKREMELSLAYVD